MDQDSIISLAGTIITLIAFGITVYQLRRTANATKAVKSAIATLRNRMSTFDTASENLKASKALQHAVTFLRLRRWDDAAAAVWEAQISINRLDHMTSLPSNDDSVSTVEYLLTAVSDLEDAADKKIDYDAKELIGVIRKKINQLESSHLSTTQEIIDV